MGKCYLKAFEEESVVQYAYVGRLKWMGWLLISLMTVIFQLGGVLMSGCIRMLLRLLDIGSQGAIGVREDIMMTYGHYIIVIISAMICFVLYIHFVEKRPFISIGLSQSSPAFKYVKGAIIALVMQISYVGLTIGLGYANISNRMLVRGTFQFQMALYVALFLILFMLQGAAEEMMTRGWVLPVLSKYYGIKGAVILSSLAFGAMHLLNSHVSVLAILNVVLYGIFACLYALKENGLWGIFANHAIWNWMMGSVFGFAVSGNSLDNISLFRITLSGPTFVTGGDFGPEGGVIVTAILLISIGVLYVRQYGLRHAYDDTEGYVCDIDKTCI